MTLRACIRLAQQLQAVEGAIENAKKALLHDYLSQSLERSLGGSTVKAQSALKDFRLIAKYL